LAYTGVMTPDNCPVPEASPGGPQGISRRSVLVGGAAGLAAAAGGLVGAGGGLAQASSTPGGGWTATPVAPVVTPLPLDIPNLGASSQLIAVMTSSWSAIHGTIEAWEKDSSGTWHQVMAPSNANVGLNGWVLASQRVQGDHKTPAGLFGIHSTFGYAANPGATLPYALLEPTYYWAGDQRDPKTYNLLQTAHPSTALWRTSQSEALYYTRPAYEYVANIDFNLPGGVTHIAGGQYVASRPANVRLGSAIFLHCYGVTGVHGYTLGCVNTSITRMVWLLRWLRADALPKIIMGPSGVIRSL
jgi:L,D-peptidoglycan transpeptidase YkuD (ErfK/YbiS/YcfS/YnhG family)